MRAVFTGTGMHVPPHVVDNHRMARVMDTSDEWIRQRTGIVERRFAGLDQATSDLAATAAEGAIAEAGIEKSEIDYVLVATMTPDYYFPGVAPIVQHKLDLPPVPCLDIRQQCSGFVYGMQLADAMLRSGQYRNVLLVGAEVHAGFMPWTDWEIVLDGKQRPLPEGEFEWNTRFRDRAVIFGDGAGAFVVSAREDGASGVEDVMVCADGDHADKMWVPGAGSAYRPYVRREMIERGDLVPIVEGPKVFKVAVRVMPEAVRAILKRNGYTVDDLRLLIMHQANLRINEVVQRTLGLEDDKVFNNIQKYGNTTAATLPMAFHEAREACGLEKGDLVCFVALGSGLTWGAALYRI
ncbi:MAG: 3-oxoacyl-ACP synthase [Gemmatimonadota bacterium]|nr:MAG: 3-oxoacyl-ACP synthase [Gemmatimonadota bacterium]